MAIGGLMSPGLIDSLAIVAETGAESWDVAL